MKILILQKNIQINILDPDGNTPLHMACGCSELRAVELLLNADANPFIRNYAGYRPIDYSKTSEITNLLIDKMKIKAIQQQGNKSLADIYSELPDNVQFLKYYIMDLILMNETFQERCKESLYQLIEEKQIALHKNNLLESAAGINDKEGGESFLDQIQYLQDENEQAAATISYLKMRIQVLESTAIQQEEYSRKNLADLTKQHTEHLQVILKRNEETEKAFLAYQKSHSDELAELNRLRTEVATLKSRNKFYNESSEEEQLQNTIEDLQKRLSEISAEKLALEERVKLAEKLKSMVDEENEQLREDIQKIQSSMKTEMMNKISSERAAKDEQDEDSGTVIFVQDESGNKQIKAATPKKLVERLTDYSSYDNQFLQAFMLTFRCFMTTNELLDLVMAQYTKKVKEGNNNNQSPLYFRIVNTLKFWIDNYWDDFENSKDLYDTLVNFIENFDDVSKVTLKAIIKRKHINEKAMPPEGLNINTNVKQITKVNPPKIILPKDIPLKKTVEIKTSSVSALSSGTTNSGRTDDGKMFSGSSSGKETNTTFYNYIDEEMSNEPSASDSANSSNSQSSGIPSGGSGLKTGDEFAVNPTPWKDTGPEDFPSTTSTSSNPNDANTTITIPQPAISHLSFLDFDPVEIANQLTVIEFDLFKVIKKEEFLDLAWMKDNKEELAPNLCKIAQWSNHVVHWLISEIVLQENFKLRVTMLERILLFTQSLLKLNNFNGVKEVSAALQSSSIYRLKKTKKAMASKFLKLYDSILKLVSNELNFKTLRTKIHTADPPLIPFPGIYQSDLVFLDSWGKNILDGGLINFIKYQKMASYILEFNTYQRKGYNIKPLPDIQNYIKRYEPLSDDEAYKYSQKCEPKKI
ncbi:ras GEF [Neocallimastix lanati (nom. inval.)]|uniref:Ras GEF n=1 Tax=Neocallimastix californiae TaxID=1754190 RepID=A0A1Y2B1V7_9FUNG|nr:ras GEF [Neocallimastix sp. JGI-2020a]ORY28065.1 ras GEF [Neocallimastix californiae]|eukprot:ORY28065.1 ras GEF [Neocallimastix californiae]